MKSLAILPGSPDKFRGLFLKEYLDSVFSGQLENRNRRLRHGRRDSGLRERLRVSRPPD